MAACCGDRCGAEGRVRLVLWVALAVNGGVAAMLYATRARNDAVANLAVLLAAASVSAAASPWPDIAVAVAIAILNLRGAAQVVGLARGELRAEAGLAAR